MNALPLVMLMLLVPGVDEPPTAVDPRTELATAIPYGLELLAAEKCEQFIKEFTIPDELGQIRERKDFEDLLRGFRKNHAAVITKVLTAIRNMAPKMNEAGNIAVYPIEVTNFSQKKVVFEKVGKYWRIRN